MKRITKRKTVLKPYESTADFKQRIAKEMRFRLTGKRYALVGAALPNKNVTRRTSIFGNKS